MAILVLELLIDRSSRRKHARNLLSLKHSGSLEVAFSAGVFSCYFYVSCICGYIQTHTLSSDITMIKLSFGGKGCHVLQHLSRPGAMMFLV